MNIETNLLDKNVESYDSIDAKNTYGKLTIVSSVIKSSFVLCRFLKE